MALFHFGQEPRDFLRIVLKIGVQRHHQFAPGLGKPGTEGRRLAKIAAEPQAGNPRIGGRQAANHLPRAIGRTVIDEHHVQVVPLPSGNLGQLLVKNCQAFGFVENGDDDGEHRRELSAGRKI